MSSLYMPGAGSSWKLIMQSGVGIACLTGITLSRFLKDELGLNEKQLSLIDSTLLDGMPVDNPAQTYVPDLSRLALAAGLPGIAGLAMKMDSQVKGLRSSITHHAEVVMTPRPGHVFLSLYSLVLPKLAEHFLKRGVLVNRDQLLRYGQMWPETNCLFKDKAYTISELLAKNIFCEDYALLTIDFKQEADPA